MIRNSNQMFSTGGGGGGGGGGGWLGMRLHASTLFHSGYNTMQSQLLHRRVWGKCLYRQLVVLCQILFLFMQCMTETEDAMDSGNMIHRRTLPSNQNAEEHLQLPQ